MYRDIDQLTAAGLIDTIVSGTRPYSAREVARLLSDAKRNLGRLRSGAGWEDEIISADLERYAPHANRAIDEARVDAAVMSSPTRAVPTTPTARSTRRSTRWRRIEAAFRWPTVRRRRSRRSTARRSDRTWPWPSPFDPPAGALPGDSGLALFRVQSASVSALLGNVRVDAGRTSVMFGQAPTSGLLLSDNAPQLDMIRVANDRPTAFPWFFHSLGPVVGTLFVADLGTTDPVYPHAKLAGYQLSMLPTSRVELGAE